MRDPATRDTASPDGATRDGGDAPSEPRPRVVLVSHGEVGSGAWRAHLLALARHARAHSSFDLVAFASPRLFVGSRGRDVLRRELERARAAVEGRVLFLPHAPRGFAPELSSRALVRALRDVRPAPGRSLVLHARGYQAALVAAGAAGRLPVAGSSDAAPAARVLHDVRGARSAEVELHGGEHAPDHVAWLEGRACRSADAHACVSRPMARWLEERHGVRDAAVFPCSVDAGAFRPDEDARRRRRRELGVGEAFLLGYVGSAAGWQRPDAVAGLLHALRSLDPGARLVALTPDVKALAAVLRAAGIRVVTRPDRLAEAEADALVVSVPPEAVPRWLPAFDATAVLRDATLVNRVASPIKIGESLAAGVPVLLTRGIGDASSLVEREGCGAAFDDPLLRGSEDRGRLSDLLRRRAADPSALRRAARDLAEREWAWSVHAPRWGALHATLAAPAQPSRRSAARDGVR